MWSPVVALTAVIVLYAYAGHQTWWRMLLTDPEAGRCGITAAVREGRLPLVIYIAFVVGWLPLMAVGWTASKLS